MRSWFLVPCSLLLIAIAACGGGKAELTADDLAAALCAATAQPDATVQASDITEASGLAASRRNKDVLWVHNDSGDTARVFAIDRSGAPLGTYTLAGADAVDWEDMAIGPGPGRAVDYLYLADIGDNAAQRPEVVVYRIPEPDVGGGDTPVPQVERTGAEKLVLRYPDQPHDAETFMVDWMNGDLLIITKDLGTNVSGVYRALPGVTPDTPTTMDQVASIDFSALTLAATPGPGAPVIVQAAALVPTGGDMSRDGKLIAIRTYGAVFVWARPPDATMADVFATQPCEAPSIAEQQGEAIAIDPDSKGYTTISEGESPPLHRFTAE
jgi:hypothetical protein